jgi:hypothetical protein
MEMGPGTVFAEQLSVVGSRNDDIERLRENSERITIDIREIACAVVIGLPVDVEVDVGLKDRLGDIANRLAGQLDGPILLRWGACASIKLIKRNSSSE